MTLTVLSVASEAVPFVKTGGLADVVGALPLAVSSHGIDMTLFLPGYPSVLRALGEAEVVHRFDDLLGSQAQIIAGKLGSQRVMALQAPDLFARDGGPYGDAQGHDWPDNWRRFAAFGKAAAYLAQSGRDGQGFDVMHAHDWQAGLAPVYLKHSASQRPKPIASVMTIHNMSFQGNFGSDIFERLDLPDHAWSIDGVEYNGGVSYLKAGLQAAHVITTVSPTYSVEIHESAFGMGLEGLIAHRTQDVHGILNGIDTDEWNPRTDPHVLAHYDQETLTQRMINKKALESEFALEPDSGPIFIVISRLTWQKGMDILLEACDDLVRMGARLALLGSGDAALEQGFLAAAARYPGRIGVRIGYDEALSHRMQSGGDAILIPSRFEPCGLTQLYAMAYGCIPVVARTGGLADTVIDANLAALGASCASGIVFAGVSKPNLANAIQRCVALYQEPNAWKKMQINGMAADFSWAQSGLAYAQLYKKTVDRVRAISPEMLA